MPMCIVASVKKEKKVSIVTLRSFKPYHNYVQVRPDILCQFIAGRRSIRSMDI